jgi:hypothetical protein
VTARHVVAAGLTGLLVALGVLLAQQEPRRSGSDLTLNGAFVVVLNGGQQACQDQELLPADTSALRLTIGTYGAAGQPLRVSVSGAHGEALTSGGLAAGWRQGVVRIPVAHVSRASDSARLCLSNEGSKPIALAGNYPDPGYTMQVAGSTSQERRLRVDYLRPGRESWFELLPTLIYRFSLGKAGFVRHWAWIAVLALMLAAVTLAVRTILTAGDPAQSARPPQREPLT